MNLYDEFDNEKIQLLKEAGIIIEDRDYTIAERKLILQKFIDYIMNFSKKEISLKINMYQNVIEKLD